MRLRTKFILILMSVGYYVACAPAHFGAPDCGSNCVNINGLKKYSYSIVPSAGKVDILFVDDNSASMSTEQNAMAARFSNFIGALNSKNVDYRIAITTTDIADSNNPARTINQNGALQDGRLIQFVSTSGAASGKYFIDKNTSNLQDLFAGTIRRPETLQCDSFLSANPGTGQTSSLYKQNCPSGDERGIMAANLAIQRNQAGFLRSDAHLVVVIVSDEDERSQAYDKTSAYALSSSDLPQNLISVAGGKSFKVHSIIVRPGSLNSGYTPTSAAAAVASGASPVNLYQGQDSGCLSVQGSQGNGVNGSYGYLYSLASKLTGGIEADVCASDYGSQLSQIGTNIGESFYEHVLNCSNPKAVDSATPIVSFTPTTGSNAFSLSGNKVYFNPNLTAGTTAYLQYTCQD